MDVKTFWHEFYEKHEKKRNVFQNFKKHSQDRVPFRAFRIKKWSIRELRTSFTTEYTENS